MAIPDSNCLIYNTEAEAISRADAEGQAIGLPYWSDNTKRVKWVSYPYLMQDGRYSLVVNGYTTLTDEENAQIVINAE
tara:strand:+ start:4177 stop:4410 length:234 start_codon:yes stop_codon:yes gene_type:complete